MHDTTVADKVEQLDGLLARIAREHRPSVLASSFGAEDMVLTDAIVRLGLEIGIVTLDTGRLPEETYRLMQQVRDRGIRIGVQAPDHEALAAFTGANGPNAFLESVPLRQACCHLRKVEPLRRALRGKAAWLTGQRREQSPTRRDLPQAEWDEVNGLHKFNPLADWTTEEVWHYIRERAVPYNALHDQGYASIGCAPCTRAILPGEDLRAGRWWWESPEGRECGLHPRRPA